VKRRAFITLLGGAAAWPLAARAQQAGMRCIGVLMAYAHSDTEGQLHFGAFRDELRRLGWIEGRTVAIEARWAPPGDVAARDGFAKEIVALRPDLIIAHSTPNTAALLRLTKTIPIVFAQVADPVESGFVASFARPGGNVTGFVVMDGPMAGKWLELLREVAPGVKRVAMLFNPGTATFAEAFLKPLQSASTVVGVEVIAARVKDAAALETAIAAHAREPDGGLIVMPDSFLNRRAAEITALAARYRVPAVYPYRFYAEAGGLLSYGVDLLDNYRHAAGYADRILKGDWPGELPVQAPVKFELVINLKAAQALGLDVPWILQQRADEVIE